ncbi:MAG: hypothetical protein EZS28_029831, partial [Streblomastix strix]
NSGHLKLRDSTFLGEAYTSIGSAIRAYPTGPSTIDVEGVVFKRQGDGQGTNGGAVYVDMRVFDVQMSFKRCIFIGNKADYGSNVFIQYASTSQLIKLNSFIGCTSIIENSYESDISVCYSFGDNEDEIFIDERNLIHSSWNRQKSEGVARFISKSNAEHIFNPNIECGSILNPCDKLASLLHYLKFEPESVDGSTGRAETIIFGEGKFTQSFIDLSLTRSSIVNIVGCWQDDTEIIGQPNVHNLMLQGGFNQNIVIERLQLTLSPQPPLVGFIKTQGAESGLVLQDIRVQGHYEMNPYNTMLERECLFSVEGFALLRDVVIEHIYLRSGSILQVFGLRRTSDDIRMEWLGKISIGLYSCTFDGITSNETALITLKEKDLENYPTQSNLNQTNSITIDNNAKTIKFIIQDTIFSNCSTSLYLNNSKTKGGLINIINKKVRFEIYNSQFRNISIKARNMIYFGWGVKKFDGKEIKILTIIETLFINCTAAIRGMKAKSEAIETQQQNGNLYSNSKTKLELRSNSISNDLYSDDEEIYDSLHQHGLIYIINLNKQSDDPISLVKIDINGLFVWNCHSAIGSAMTVTRLTLDLSESNIEDPMCFGNQLYLNQTHATVRDCYFSGYDDIYIGSISQISDIEGESEQLYIKFCPNNPNLYSSAQHALVYIYKGTFFGENDIFEETRVGGIKLEDSNVELKNISFIDPWNEQSPLDGSELMVTCGGSSKLNIIEPIVNNMTEQQCSAMNYQLSIKSNKFLNENENECRFGFVSSEMCQYNLSDAWKLQPLPIPIVVNAKVIVNVQKKQQPLQFYIEGERFILALFMVRIVELRDKTQSEIHNINDDELMRDDKGYIIWPLDNATKLPITSKATVLNNKNAIFSMSDYSFLDPRKKWYGILISNNGNHFAGVDGKEDEPVILQVEVEDGEQFVNYVRFKLASYKAFLISPVVVIIITIILSAIIYKIWRRQYDKKQDYDHNQIVNQQWQIRALERKIVNSKQNKMIQMQIEAEQNAIIPYREDPTMPHEPKTVNFEDLGTMKFLRY